MKTLYFLLSVGGVVFTCYLLSHSLKDLHDFNNVILITIQFILFSISIVGLIMNFNCIREGFKLFRARRYNS
jgi:hypothetical protein